VPDLQYTYTPKRPAEIPIIGGKHHYKITILDFDRARSLYEFCISFPLNALFVGLISHQPIVLFSQNKPATSNQPAVLFS
jgi:hypothetical protein